MPTMEWELAEHSTTTAMTALSAASAGKGTRISRSSFSRAEAYNVEMGISNEVFTQDRPLPG